MDWKVILTTFGMIFLAEMGDKTQLAAMTMAAQTKKPLAVFIGASLALVCVSALGVVVGEVLSHYIPLEWIERAAAVATIVIGALILLGQLLAARASNVAAPSLWFIPHADTRRARTTRRRCCVLWRLLLH